VLGYPGNGKACIGDANFPARSAKRQTATLFYKDKVFGALFCYYKKFITVKKFTFKNKYVAIVAAFLILSGAGATFAFKAPAKVLPPVQYQFNGTTLTQDKSASNYSVVSGSGPSCAGTALPCVVSVSGDLQTWLNARTATQIKDQAISIRD
jgi:hypothetical protein